MAAATARYKARKTAEKYGVVIPKAIERQRPAAYHPPTAELRAILGGRTKGEADRRAKSHARHQAAVTAAERASARAQEAREARARVIGQLPQARNVEGEIHAPRPLKRRVAKNADATEIRRKAASEKLQAAGRGLKRDFKSKPGTVYAEVEGRLSRRELATFREYMDRLGQLSPQALAIYFHHEGGSGALDSVITGILYPPDGGSPSDALQRLELIVVQAEKGEAIYGEKSIAKLDAESRASLGADELGRIRI
jgi:hypothetical protein